MALIFKTQTVPDVPGPVKQGFSWDEWYSKNRTRLSEKRARRYREDAAYRQAALDRSRQQRMTKKVPITDAHTVSFNDAAQELGVTVWVLREWRRKNYFPEPYRRDGRMWFSTPQVEWLQLLKKFFDKHGTRVVGMNRQGLEDLVGLLYANWN